MMHNPNNVFVDYVFPVLCLPFSDRGAYHGFISFDFIGWDMRASISSCQLRSNWRSGWNVCSLTNSMFSLVVCHISAAVKTYEISSCLYGFMFGHLVFRCVIRGCVPKKILVYGASFGGEIEVRI